MYPASHAQGKNSLGSRGPRGGRCLEYPDSTGKPLVIPEETVTRPASLWPRRAESGSPQAGRSSSRPRREPRGGKQRGCSQPAGPRPESNRLATRSVRERDAPLLRAVSTEEQQEGKRAPAPYGPAAQQAPDLGGSQLILSDLDDMPSALGTADPTLTTPVFA